MIIIIKTNGYIKLNAYLYRNTYCIPPDNHGSITQDSIDPVEPTYGIAGVKSEQDIVTRTSNLTQY